MCRTSLRRYQKTCNKFIGKIGPVNNEGRLVIKNVRLLNNENVVLGKCNHICVSQKPFKTFKQGQEIIFTGKIFEYQRANSTMDYSVKVNKVKKSIKKSADAQVSFFIFKTTSNI